MRILILFIIVFGLLNCVKKKAASVKSPIKYYFIENRNNGRTHLEITPYRNNKYVNEYEEVATENIKFNNANYVIKKFSNIKTAAIDGEVELFYSDTLLLYVRSMNWGRFTMLQTNDDSTNRVISNLMGYIMSNPDFYLKEGLMEKL